MAELQNQSADLSDEAPTLEITHVLTDAEARAVLADITQEVELADVLAVADLGTTADTLNTLPVGTPSPLLVVRDPFATTSDSIAPVAVAACAPPKREPTNPEIAARTKALRAEPTQLLPRTVLTSLRAAMKKKQARTALMLVAAIGSWAFFASFATLGAYGVVVAVRAHAHGPARDSVERVATTPPSSDGLLAAALPAHPVFVAEPVPERPRALASVDDGAEDATDQARSGGEKLGILRFVHATNGVLVDGAPHKVTGNALFVTCGSHRVRVSHGGSHTVIVPCGRTVTL